VRRKSKKKINKKRLVIVILIPVLVISLLVVGGILIFRDKDDNTNDNVNEVKKVDQMENYDYYLEEDVTEYYKELYNEGIISSQPTLDYEFSKTYAHVLITGQSNDPEKVYDSLKKEIQKFKENGINEVDYNRMKKMIYGGYVKEYNDVSNISRMFLADYFKGINSFDYLEEIEGINVEYLNQVLNDVFKEEKMLISIVRN